MGFVITSGEVWVTYECPYCGHEASALVEADAGQHASLEVYSVVCENCDEEFGETDEPEDVK